MRVKWSGRFEGYSFAHFKKDLLSGTIVGIIAVPLAMSFAIASGVKPEYGIYTAIIAGILISLLGGSKFQIGGPTGAFVPILLGVVLVYGYENLLIAGLMAGIMLLLMGMFKLGSLIKFIPRPVTVGFTAGIAVIIFTGQIGNFLGLTNMEQHEKFHMNVYEIVSNIDTVNFYSLLVGIISFALILMAPKVLPKVPGALIGIIVSSVVTVLFLQGHVATIGSTYGAIPNTLPQFHIPEITFERIYMLIGPAFVIAMLGGIESLLSAVVADGMTNSKHNSNRELIGQGVANIVTPFFGGIPATGAIARTATNIKSGAVSPLSGVIHGIFVLITLLLLAPLAVHIPLASLAPVLMMVAWNMSERHHFVHILKLKSGDSLVLCITFLLTVFMSLTVAVMAGLILAVILFAKSMSDSLTVSKVLPNLKNDNGKVQPHFVADLHDCPQISIYTIEGPLFFGAAEKFEHTMLKTIQENPKVFILRMRKVPYIDSTGEEYFRNILQNIKASGGIVFLTNVQPGLEQMLKRSGLYDLMEEEHFYHTTNEAISAAFQYIQLNKCIGCTHYVLEECRLLSNGVPLPEQELLVQKKLTEATI
ncbi:SulP family sulfate permease [Solibacillus kalamii]|uniref:Sodium-independent anion transporter n=1 Tax=Solibacillus kalamii TaxID=1748298 RepID=A0ABX3ZE20_9BACL|nr:sulfate permease [Solibacillus kalamii]MBM7666465.1 SulP family sulfate permease [Solibacillus kalamii]OUZ37943.1 sodium-independent anion transporter [Solibacillus kalamii]